MRDHANFNRRTKIVCTIGPATNSEGNLRELINAGMNIARLNLSHGTYETHEKDIKTIKILREEMGRRVGILIDLPGPKYRVGRLAGKSVLLSKGDILTLTGKDIEGDGHIVPVTLPNLSNDIKVGDSVLLDDGAMQLEVQEICSDCVVCRIIVGGTLTERRGLVVPGMKSSLPFITDLFRKNLSFAISQHPDYIAVSFASCAEDVAQVKELLRKENVDIPIITKIERGLAVDHFEEILLMSDGIMVARGDLGVDMPLEQVPFTQKEIIRRCNISGKPVITATQMLESMIINARPTRAEVTDVANAIFDGTDAIMLSGETSMGNFPLLAVQTMDKIARETERHLPYERNLAERHSWIEHQTEELISYSACVSSHELNARAIVAFTQSGATPRRVCRYRPKSPIIALVLNENVANRLLLFWGVYPFVFKKVYGSVEELIGCAVDFIKELGEAKPEDLLVITGGLPIMSPGNTNLLKIERVVS